MSKMPKKIYKNSEKEKSPVRKIYFGEKNEEIRILGSFVIGCSDDKFVRAGRSRAVTLRVCSRFCRWCRFASGFDSRGAKDGSGRIFIVQQTRNYQGFTARLERADGFYQSEFEDRHSGFSGDERGLLGLTFHPQFTSNGEVLCQLHARRTARRLIPNIDTDRNGSSNTGDIATRKNFTDDSAAVFKS